MAFIQPITPSSGPDLTRSLPLAAQQLQRIANLQFNQVVASCKKGWETVWENPNYYTPTEVLAAMGTNAADSFRVHAATVVYIETVAPGTLANKYKSVGQPVTVHEDGTVTVNS